jgi:hypothetical protein
MCQMAACGAAVVIRVLTDLSHRGDRRIHPLDDATLSEPEHDAKLAGAMMAARRCRQGKGVEGGKTMTEIEPLILADVAAWSGIDPPNDPARRLAADLATTIAAFEAVRGQLRFEDEPSSFEVALLATKEPR